MDASRARWVIAAVVVLACLGSWWALTRAGRPGPVYVAVPPPPARALAEPTPVEPGPRPEPRVEPRTYHLTRDEAPPPAPRERASEPMELEELHSFQRAGVETAGHAKRECLRPWAEQTGAEVEVVMDAVVHDGVVVDFRLRSLTELPDDVLDCVRDQVWAVEWPMADVSGEMTFQETIHIEPR